MVPRRIVVMSWFCLMILASPAWAGQALLVKGMEAQKAGRNEEALKLLNDIRGPLSPDDGGQVLPGPGPEWPGPQ